MRGIQVVLLTLLAGCASEPAHSVEEPKAAAEIGEVGSTYTALEIEDGGAVNGRIFWSGTVPPREALPVTRNTDHCGQVKQSEALLVDVGGGVSNVIVEIAGITRGKPFPPVEGNPILDQVACAFVPHVQVVPPGSRLEFVNSDAILHNVHGFQGETTVFNVAMPVKNQKAYKTVNTPGLIRIQCDSGHGWMSAFIMVAENPYYALSGPDGRYEISELPPGEYQLRIWHEARGRRSQPIRIEAGKRAEVNIDLSAQ